MKVYMPSPREDWICDVIIDEFKARSRHEFVNEPREADLIFLYAKWIWKHIPFGLLTSKPVITTVHHIVPEKTNVNEFIQFNQFTTQYHVPNKHTAAMLKRFSFDIPVINVPYWINTSRWGAIGDETPVNVDFVVGSFQRDTEGHSIGKDKRPEPKLEKGPDVFVDIVYKFAPGEIMAVIPGWRRNFLIDALEKYNPIISHSKLPSNMMNSLYNSLRANDGYYLVTSRYEGGPQAVFEASQTRTKILSTDVGIASEILHPDCICSDVDDFVKKIRESLIDHTIDYNYESVQKFAVDKMVPRYDDMIEKVYNESLHKS